MMVVLMAIEMALMKDDDRVEMMVVQKVEVTAENWAEQSAVLKAVGKVVKWV